MKVTNLPEKFNEARPILKKLQEHGYEAYFVGGSVRDTLLHDKINDVDIATSAYPAEVKGIFKHTVDTGIKHGTVMVLDHGRGYETTTFRTESTYQDFRRPDKVTFVRSLKKDLQRRDLTINALAMDPEGEIIDLFGGLKDLQSHIIKAVGDPNERFHEDALRMMRAVRFVSQLDFHLEQNTREAISANAKLLTKIALERIHVEWIKLLLGIAPKEGLHEFIQTGLYHFCPWLADKKENLENIANLPDLHLNNEEEAWVLLGHYFCQTPEQTGKMVREWKSSNQMINDVVKAQRALEKFPQLSPQILYQTGLPLLQTADHIADYEKRALPGNKLLALYKALPLKAKSELQLTGSDLITELGLKPGPQMGKIIKSAEKLVLNGKLPNDKQTLLQYAKSIS